MTVNRSGSALWLHAPTDQGGCGIRMRAGGRLVEAYPVEPGKKRMPDIFAFHGLAVSFSRAGFREVARRSKTRPVMRYEIGN